MNVTLFGLGKSGGMHHYSIQLANGLNNYTDVSLVIPEGGDAIKYIDDGVNYTPYTIPAYDNIMNKPNAAIKMYYNIYKSVKKTDPDIVHNTFSGPTQSLLALPIFNFFSAPVVSTLHDPVKVTGKEITKFNQIYYIVKNKLGVCASDLTLVHGESTLKQAIEAGYGQSDMKTISHMKYDIFKLFDYEKFKTEPNTLLFFGKIRPEKGFDRIIPILDEVEQEIPDVSAIVAGKPQESQNKLVEKLRKDGRVELHAKYIPNNRVGEFFTRASIVVLPYYRATSSGVLMTAYAFEKPVVATKVGDIPQLILEDRVGYISNNVNRISKPIIQLLTNKCAYQDKKENIQESAIKYSWKRVGLQTKGLYNSMIT